KYSVTRRRYPRRARAEARTRILPSTWRSRSRSSRACARRLRALAVRGSCRRTGSTSTPARPEPAGDLGSTRTECDRPANSPSARCGWERSEEHTSELQSLAYLVCRLLLEKKKQIE